MYSDLSFVLKINKNNNGNEDNLSMDKQLSLRNNILKLKKALYPSLRLSMEQKQTLSEKVDGYVEAIGKAMAKEYPDVKTFKVKHMRMGVLIVFNHKHNYNIVNSAETVLQRFSEAKVKPENRSKTKNTIAGLCIPQNRVTHLFSKEFTKVPRIGTEARIFITAVIEFLVVDELKLLAQE